MGIITKLTLCANFTSHLQTTPHFFPQRMKTNSDDDILLPLLKRFAFHHVQLHVEVVAKNKEEMGSNEPGGWLEIHKTSESTFKVWRIPTHVTLTEGTSTVASGLIFIIMSAAAAGVVWFFPQQHCRCQQQQQQQQRQHNSNDRLSETPKGSWTISAPLPHLNTKQQRKNGKIQDICTHIRLIFWAKLNVENSSAIFVFVCLNTALCG